MANRVGFPVIIAGFGLLFALGNAELRRFERLAAREIGSKLDGPHKEVHVHARPNGLGVVSGDMRRVTIEAKNFKTEGLPLFTESELSKRGRVRNLDLKLENFQLGKLRVEELSASIPNCRYDFGLAITKQKIRLSESGVGQGRVRIKAADLEQFILAKFHEIKSVTLRLDGERAFVKGYGDFLVISTNFEVAARLASSDGVTINLVDCDISFDGMPAGENAKRVLLETLNPVVDLRKDLGLYDAIALQGIRLQNDYLEAWGQTKIPVRPK